MQEQRPKGASHSKQNSDDSSRRGITKSMSPTSHQKQSSPPWMMADKVSIWEKTEISLYKLVSIFPLLVTFGLYTYLFIFYVGVTFALVKMMLTIYCSFSYIQVLQATLTH